jgi:hypothetical protein
VRGSDCRLARRRDRDLIRYDPVSGVAVLEFDEDAFDASENVDAVFGPEPGTGALLARRRR